MSCINRQSVTATSISLRATNGVTWTITLTEIRAIYASKTGTAAARLAATVEDVKAAAKATLGESLNLEELFIELDGATRIPKKLVLGANE